MSDYTPKVGDRVRVTSVVEGVVTEEGPAWFDIKTATGTATIYAETTSDRTIERLPDPEPEWQPGDVALDECCGLALIRDDGGWRDRIGRHLPDGEFIERCNLRPVILGGKPVTT